MSENSNSKTPNRQTPKQQEPTQCRPHKEDGEILLMGAMLRSMRGEPVPEGSNHSSEAIYASEARGQAEMVRSESLPVRTNCCSDTDLEAMGIELGQPFDEDPIFRPAILPDGWGRQGTDHNMWSGVYDDRGRKRMSIFYKAAFYDRNAHVNAEHRFVASTGRSLRQYDPNDDHTSYSDKPGDDDCVVLDYGKGEPPAVLFRVEVSSQPTEARTREETPEQRAAWDTYFKDQKLARKATSLWLDAHYPEWQSPAAYWDEE